MSFRILLFWSNPKDRDHLRLVDEQNLISDFINSHAEEEIEFDSRGGAKIDDFWKMAMTKNPNLVHISGHGTANNEICFEDEEGYEEKVNIDEIINYLNDLDSVECLILNSCFSSKNIDKDKIKFNFLIGMSDEIPNDTANLFSKSFYEALLMEKNFRKSFKYALKRVRLTNTEESTIPKLFEKKEQKDGPKPENNTQLISEEEIQTIKKSIKNYRDPIFVIFSTLVLTICCFVFFDPKGEDSTNEIAMLIIFLIGIYYTRILLKNISIKLNEIFVLEMKRKRFIMALGRLNVNEIKELNSNFYKYIVGR